MLLGSSWAVCANLCCIFDDFLIVSPEELHLTKVDAICTLQPQFEHLDAITDNERTASRVAAAGDHPAPETEARAVSMAVQSTEDESMDMYSVGKQLRAMQEESWQRLEWFDEDVSFQYHIYKGRTKVC